MNIIKKQDLGQVVMPLIQVMERADLSWRDRERIAAAINACTVQWESMERERQQLAQQREQQATNTNRALQGMAGTEEQALGKWTPAQVQAGAAQQFCDK